MAVGNEQTRLLREAWKKAMREGEVRLEFKEQRTAYRVRMALYNAGNKAACRDDWELGEARVNCQVRVLSPTILLIVRADRAADTQELADLLGETVSHLSPQQREEQESAARIKERLRGEEVDPEFAALGQSLASKFLRK